jgi:hypothetical protein
MAKRPSTPKELRDAVERTVQATVGSAERSRDRAQGDLANLRDSVDDIVRKAVTGALDARPATHEDIRELRAELRKIGRRLDAIEERLPAKRSTSKRT